MASGRARWLRGHASFHRERAFHANERRPHSHDAPMGSTAAGDGFLYRALRAGRCDWSCNPRDATRRGHRSDSFFHGRLARKHSCGSCRNNSSRAPGHASLAPHSDASPLHFFCLVVHPIAHAFARDSGDIQFARETPIHCSRALVLCLTPRSGPHRRSYCQGAPPSSRPGK